MSVPPFLAIAVQYYYQERALPPWRQDILFDKASGLELASPETVAEYFYELFIPLAERQRGGEELRRVVLRETTPLFAPPMFPFGDNGFYHLRRKEQLYYTQSSTEDEMLERLAGFREHGEDYLRQVEQERKGLFPWKQFTVTTLMSGHSIYMCSEEQLLRPLVDRGKVYPFDRGDIPHLLATKYNPYASSALPLEYINYLYRERTDWRQSLSFYSLEEVLQGLFNLQSWCPVRLSTQYYRSPIPLSPSARFPGASSYYNMTPWHSYYVYQEEEDTGRAQLILDPYRKPYFSGTEKRISDRQVLQAIADFHNNRTANFRQIPRNLWSRFDALSLKSEQPVRLYRGLGGIANPGKRGASFQLSSDKVQSWTTSFCVAQNYASLWHPKGIVVSAILRPSDILVDSRYIAVEQLRATVESMRRFNGKGNIPDDILFVPPQIEVLSKPGTYTVVIESINRQKMTGVDYPALFTHYRSDLLTDKYIT